MVSLKFKDVKDESFLEMETDISGKYLFISIENDDSFSGVELDRKTAVKLSKELRRLIAQMNDPKSF